MKKIIVYLGSILSSLAMNACLAIEKFEVLPDLPDPLSQAANATTVTKGTTAVSAASIGHEPTVLSVILSLAFVVVLIYATGILYARLNRASFQTMKKQKGFELARSQATVISTTQLGNSKTLHVIELDGKRMLIGASTSTIQLIKDLGTFSENEDTEEYSRIEIPNIKIPKLEIPKIEIPSLKLSKIITRVHAEDDLSVSSSEIEDSFTSNEQDDGGDKKDAIIESLFPDKDNSNDIRNNKEQEHKVDPDEYALYRKYIS